MSGTEGSWQEQVHRIIAGLEDGRARIDRGAVRNLVNTYAVRSLDGTALRFSLRSSSRRAGGIRPGCRRSCRDPHRRAIKAAVPSGGTSARSQRQDDRHSPNVRAVTLIASGAPSGPTICDDAGTYRGGPPPHAGRRGLSPARRAGRS